MSRSAALRLTLAAALGLPGGAGAAGTAAEFKPATQRLSAAEFKPTTQQLLAADFKPTTQPLLAAASPSPETSALSILASRAAEAIRRAAAEPPIALRIDGTSPELARGFATLLAAQLASRQLPAFILENEEAPVTSAQKAEARTLARLDIQLVREKLRVRGEVIGTWKNFWSGSVETRPATPAAVLAFDAPSDALAVALAARPPAPQLRLDSSLLTELTRWPGAIAAMDLDEDRRAELVVLDPSELRVHAADGTVRATRSLEVLPLSSTPCREPWGALGHETTPLRITAFNCGRSRGELLVYEQGALRPTGSLDVPRLGGGDAQEIAPLLPGQPQLETQTVQLTKHGALVLRLRADGIARIEYPDAPPLQLSSAGSAVALADLDGDGTPELVAASEGTQPRPELMRVWRLQELEEAATKTESSESVLDLRGIPRAAELPMETGRIVLLTSGDLDGNGRDELVAASWEEDGRARLWKLSGGLK